MDECGCLKGGCVGGWKLTWVDVSLKGGSILELKTKEDVQVMQNAQLARKD